LALALGCSGARAPDAGAPAEDASASQAPAVRVVPEEPVVVAARPAPPAPAIRELEPEEALLESRIDEEEGVAPEEAPEASAVLAESLEAFESAQAFWEQGAHDDAFAALDRAYELMASVPMNGDPTIAQEKENLRHLISRRVVEIYASRQSAVGDPNRSIQLTLNEDVEREIALFQGP